MRLFPITTQKPAEEFFASPYSQDLFALYETYYPKIGFTPPWIGYFILRDEVLVGTCSFTGQPIDGRVEIAYWTFPEFEGRGIATWACKELLSIAKQHDPNVIVTAKTAPEVNASTAILTRNGFKQTRIVQDHEIGDAWEWVFTLPEGIH
ncbi:MAG TPA: GNAT family N-acetyltransferase [Bacteroidia bacterium]|nr:GNAT family N-acetyltransferase [Bacteroidia bacterium]